MKESSAFENLFKYGLRSINKCGKGMSESIVSVTSEKFNGFSTDMCNKIEKIIITRTVKQVVWNGLERSCFYSFEVDPANPIFQQFNGVLYTRKGYDRYGDSSRKRMIELVACPTNIKIHNVIHGTLRIANCAFKGSHISKLTFSNTLEEIGANAFYFTDRLKSIDIPKSIKIIEQQKESSIDTINYDEHIFHNWHDLFAYMMKHGFEKKNNNIVRQQIRIL